jgi:hypothetical protein
MACGKTYAWNAQFAGRTVRRKCGGTIQLPAPAMAASAAVRVPRLASQKQGKHYLIVNMDD